MTRKLFLSLLFIAGSVQHCFAPWLQFKDGEVVEVSAHFIQSCKTLKDADEISDEAEKTINSTKSNPANCSVITLAQYQLLQDTLNALEENNLQLYLEQLSFQDLFTAFTAAEALGVQFSNQTEYLDPVILETIASRLAAMSLDELKSYVLANQKMFNHNRIKPLFVRELMRRSQWSCQHVLQGKRNRRMTLAAFSPDDTRIITVSSNNTAQIWNAQTGNCLHILQGHTGHIASASFNHDGTHIVTISNDRTAKIWCADTGRCLRTLQGHTDMVTTTAFSPDGTHIVTTSWDRTAKLWSTQTGHCLHTLQDHTNPVSSAAFSPDGTRIVTTSWDNTAKLWSTQTGHCLHTLEGHTHALSSAAFSPDGNRIVTTSWDNTAKLWSTQTGHCLHTLEGHTHVICRPVFSPDGNRIVTASWDRTARIWSAQTGRCLHALEGHTDSLNTAAFSPHGDCIITSSHDRTTKLWSTQTGNCLQTLQENTALVHSATFSHDGTHIVTASQDNTARIWVNNFCRVAHNCEQLMSMSLNALWYIFENGELPPAPAVAAQEAGAANDENSKVDAEE